MKKLFTFLFLAWALYACGPSKAELVAREIAKQDSILEQDSLRYFQEKAQPIGSVSTSSVDSVTNFSIKLGEGHTQGGRLITVKHNECDFVVWFNDQGMQVLHSPTCKNYSHK